MIFEFFFNPGHSVIFYEKGLTSTNPHLLFMYLATSVGLLQVFMNVLIISKVRLGTGIYDPKASIFTHVQLPAAGQHSQLLGASWESLPRAINQGISSSCTDPKYFLGATVTTKATDGKSSQMFLSIEKAHSGSTSN